jgi:hypothetical protein
LKTGPLVASEGTIVRHEASGRGFLVVWQNCLDDVQSLNAMTFLVDNTIARFLASP